MKKYAETAIKAAELIVSGSDPESAWEKASCIVFIPNSTSQKKGCPKNAFLALYGVKTKGKNATYALNALHYLKNNPAKSITEDELWDIALDGEQKTYNSQMAVVLALWEAGYLK